ncbi:hypothetical protein GBA52_001498 [Prunus armeniaca]|nr:hypothetical protein GBA52_001498 [Prunus armeniaca]
MGLYPKGGLAWNNLIQRAKIWPWLYREDIVVHIPRTTLDKFLCHFIRFHRDYIDVWVCPGNLDIIRMYDVSPLPSEGIFYSTHEGFFLSNEKSSQANSSADPGKLKTVFQVKSELFCQKLLTIVVVHLNLGTNSLSGRIPSELGFLYKLKELDLAVNQLTGTVALSIYNISSLVLFTVASNQLWGEIPSNIGHTLPNLLYFRTCINQFTGKIPASLHNISGIRSIRLANNLFEGSVPPGLGNLQFLEMYNIGFNQILSYGDDGLSFLTSLTNNTRLQFLGIDDNNLEGVIPESIGNLSGVIEKLYMGGNHIYGHIPSSIGHLSSLTLLNVSYNLISGAIPPEIGQLKDLQMLGLVANKMSGHIPNSLGNLRMLNNIDLSGNYFVGNIPPSFPNFQKLLSMDLSNNFLNGSISREIFLSLPKIGLLGTVVTIDLSNNRFSGSIPSSIGKCSSLVGLFMVRNTLSGPLPNALGEMKGLEILDLSSNQLSGSIPDTLKDLRVLRSLNLSFNLLEGVIPNGGIFVKNISSVYLEGNPKLCLHFPCVESAASSHRR